MKASYIAVDVVLIPPDEVIQLAIGINKTFPDTAAAHYVLDAKTCIPHITLLMGLISKEQISEANNRLSALAERRHALDLTITRATVSPRSDGKVLSGLEIEKTPELQQLHEETLEEMNSLFYYEGVTPEMFYTPPSVNEVPMYWAQGFAKTKVRDQYRPHITLGIGESKQEIAPVRFRATTLALCHLGTYCTCREILWSTPLS